MSEEYDQKQMLGDPKRRPAAKKYIKQDVSGGIRLEPKECIPMEDISPKAQQRVSEYNQQRGNRNTLSSDDDGDSESWSATKPSRRSATFEELNRFAQSVRNQEAMSAEDRHRQMSIVYSRRKRLRQKHRIEHFELQCDEYRVKNERLRHENMHLEAMLATAHQQLRKEGVRLNELLQEQQQQQQQEQTKTQQSPSQPSLPPPPPQLSGNTAQPPNQSQNPFMRGHLASIMDNNNQNHHSLLSSLFAGNLTAQTINDDRNKFTSSATEGNNAYNDNAILNNVLQQMLQHQRLQHPQLQNPTKSPSQQQNQKSGVNHSTSRRRSGGGEEEEHGSAAINLSLMIQRMQQSLQAQQPATPQQQQRSTSPQQQRSTQQQSPSAQAKQFSPRSQE